MAQNELQNISLSKTEMAGGNPSSGISTTLAYTFLSKKKLKLLNIQFEDKHLTFNATDTLVIYLITQHPYGGYNLGDRPVYSEYEDKISF